ncbi:MAG: hypothetical protein ABI488_26615 [Polyangiaceae bacterium]
MSANEQRPGHASQQDDDGCGTERTLIDTEDLQVTLDVRRCKQANKRPGQKTGECERAPRPGIGK